MMPLMISVAAVLASAAVATGWVLSGRLAGDGLAASAVGRMNGDQQTVAVWPPAGGATRRASPPDLTRKAMTRTDYDDAMSVLAAEDESRHPLAVPRLHAD
jgi:hypothetical protein